MLSVMYFPFAGCVWNTVPNREVLPLQMTHDRCMNKKRSISRTLDAWHRYRKTLWIFSFLHNTVYVQLIIEAVLQSTNSGDETAEKRQSIIGDRFGQPICERAQGQQRDGLKLDEITKNTGTNHLNKKISLTKWMWIFSS